MLVRCRAQGIDGDANIAIGAVFKANRHGQARGQFAVNLTFGGAGADGTPADEVADELWRNRIQKFRGAGQT